MANKEIDELTTAGLPLDGTEQFHILQGANSRELNVLELANYVGTGPQANYVGKARYSRPGDIFTAENGGSPNTNAYQGNGTWEIRTVGDQGSNFAGVSFPGGNADFDIVMAFAGHLTTDSSASQGMYIEDSASGKKIALVALYDQSFLIQFWTGTTFNSTENTITQHESLHIQSNDVYYMRITRVGTTYTFYVCSNGLDWITIGSKTTSDHGTIGDIDEVGFMQTSASVSALVPNWIRCVGYDTDGVQPEMQTGGGTLPVAFRGFRVTKSGSNQTPASFTDELVTFETVEHDSESAFNTTNDDEYIVPGGLDGKYMVFMAGVDNIAVADGRITVRQNGNNIGSNWFENAFYGQAVTPPVLVAEDDLIDVEVNMSAVAIQTGIQTFFGGFVVETSEDAFDYVEDTTTTRTLSDADFRGNRTLEMNNAAAITITLDTGLTAAGPLTIIQGGAGQITMSGTATIQSSGSATKSNGQETGFTLIPTNDADTYKMIGTITA